MFVIIGTLVVIGSIIGGYLMVGGHLAVLFQPAEIVIIGGSGIGAFITANKRETIAGAISGLIGLLKGPKYGSDDYLELLILRPYRAEIDPQREIDLRIASLLGDPG